MATYAMTLGECIDFLLTENGITGTLNTEDKINQGCKVLFNFTYPFYDESKRTEFEQDFIRNFYTREIGFETEQLFQLKLHNWLILNIGYWNKMFQSELLSFDPLTNVKQTTTIENDNTSSSTINGNESHLDHATTGNDTTSTVTDNDFNRQLATENPDGRTELTTADGTGVIAYATNMNENKGNASRDTTQHVGGNNDSNGSSNQSQTANGNQTLNGTTNQTGKIGDSSFSKLLQEYRQTFLRLERDCFNEMNVLFMMIY